MKKWSITFAALLVVLLASCNPINSTPSVKGEGILERKTLNISVSASSDDLIAFPKTSANARTIIGDSFVLNGTTPGEQLYFYLYGNSQDGTVLDPKEISVSSDDGITGKVLIDIECLNWELTLVAATTRELTDTNAILDEAVLIGYANVDMQFTNNIKFTLTPDGLTKPGNVNLSVKLDNWTPPTGYEATAKIVNMKDGSTVKNTNNTDLLVENIVFGDENFQFDSIAPGIYTFLVDFVKEGERRTYNYSDTIIILPGRTITKDVIIPKKIQDKPIAPTNFVVEYIADSEDIRAGFYEAKFTWTDNSNNESNFALEILEINENDELLTDPWENADNTVYVFDYDNDIRANSVFYKEGSLFANNTSITVYLGLGKRYMARLYAQNDAGLSDADEGTDGDQSPALSITGHNTASYLNRYKITYNLQGGTLTKDGNPYNVKYVEYYSQPDNPAIITPNGEGTNPTLQIGSGENAVNWTYWEKDSEKYEEASYTGFKNLDLYAVYAREGEVEVYDPNNYEILDDYITSFTDVSKTETKTYSKAGGTDVQIKLDNEIDWNYDTVSLKIEYSGRIFYYLEQDGADSNTFEIDLTKLPSGRVYNFVLTATYGTTIVTYPMSINITD